MQVDEAQTPTKRPRQPQLSFRPERRERSAQVEEMIQSSKQFWAKSFPRSRTATKVNKSSELCKYHFTWEIFKESIALVAVQNFDRKEQEEVNMLKNDLELFETTVHCLSLSKFILHLKVQSDWGKLFVMTAGN